MYLLTVHTRSGEHVHVPTDSVYIHVLGMKGGKVNSYEYTENEDVCPFISDAQRNKELSINC